MVNRIGTFLLFFLCLVLLANTGCKNDGNSDGKLKFYYYPEKNVYYNVENSNYLYSLNGGKSWDSLKMNEAKETKALGKREVIYSETPQVWRSNMQHLKSYNGNSFAIAGYGAANELMAEDVVSEKKVVRSGPVVRKGSSQKKEKKGIGKFIDNIFGKKKRKD